MRELQDMTIGQRIAITFLIVLLILFALALFGWTIGRWDEAPAAPSKQIALCSDEPGINDRINEIAFRALDHSLEQQIGSLFLVWMKDDTEQPARAATGVKRAALAYVHARQAILDLNIPPCT